MTETVKLDRVDCAPGLELPTDHRRGGSRAEPRDQVPIGVSAGQVAGLRALTGDAGADLATGLLAAFATLLHRYSGQDDFVVGFLPGSSAAQQVGHRSVRIDLAGQPSFRELVSRVRSAVEAAATNGAAEPVPSAMLVLVRDDDGDIGGATPSRQEVDGGPGPDVRLLLGTTRTDPGPVTGVVDFAAELFERATIEAFAEHLDVLVDSIVADPDRPVSRLELLNAGHRARLAAWCSATVPVPERCFHLAIEDHARMHPDATAVVYEQQSLTYDQLNVQANRLAHRLRGRGVGRGSLVALCVERGPDMVVGILGILKSGAAYVPIDALLYPTDRIAFVLADASVQLVVTHASLHELLPEDGPPVVCLDDADEAAAIAGGSPENPTPPPALDDLAYVIYTSGSTGTPKGVMVEHRGLANLLAVIPGIVDVAPHDRHLQFAPASFDMSIGDLLLSLCFGATLCIAPLASLRSGEALAQQLRSQRITHATVAPSVLARIPDGAELPDLTAIAVAAETCPAHIVTRWAPGRRFFNVYGPTETTIAATVAECRADGDGDPPIGRPVPNVQVHVVDENLQLVPIGVPGELCIAGAGVTAGYLGRPELTADRFVEDPYGRPGGKLYRTGDRARWRRDGNLEFLGRTDDQVKLRGYRIELGEIEATIRGHSQVREVAVVMRGLPPEPQQLVAYLVGDPRPTDDELRAHIARTLPYYMVPKLFVWLDSLPLTPNGKVDRLSLPAPDVAG